MNAVPKLESASGLRPASAFVSIAIVLAVAAAWVANVALVADLKSRDSIQVETDPDPEYTIVDREQRPLALFVQRLDLVMSPNAMWQAHTPQTMAEELADVLAGAVDEATLLRNMLPDADALGTITASFKLDPTQASRIDRWIATGSPLGEDDGEALPGMWVERGARGYWVLRWRPIESLSDGTRALHGERYVKYPLRWTRYIADGLADALMGEDALANGEDEEQLDAQRDEIWKALMPTNWCVAVRGFDAARAQELLDVLNAQSVAWHQMRIARERDRQYPGGKLAILGTWGFIDRPEAQRRALLEFGYPREYVATPEQRAELIASFELGGERNKHLSRATWRYLASPLPVTGLERACDALLGDSGDWTFLDDWQAAYQFRRDRSVRGKLTRSYYLDSNEASDTPRVRTTFDALLQRRTGELLDELIAKHDPAVAMAIAIDVRSGDVLAVDSRDQYGIAGFAPLFHEFMPGSTMKVPVMATALESGNVQTEDRFNVGMTRHYRLGPRTINEAESSRTGWLSATECLAFSVNAGLVQIGLKVPSDYFRSKLAALHYGDRPRSGLGGERGGLLPPLPWSEFWTHASVSYGYEIMTTLWQHVAALAAVVRGGDWLPLRIIDAVEQNGVSYALPRAQSEPVFSGLTCARVRAMMQLGAREGTGKRVAGVDKLPDLMVGSKTGTAQKTPGEVCMHVELADQAAHREHGTKCGKACRAGLAGRRAGHGTCYTSSMCVFGRVDGAGHDTDREVMVLVVADDPRKAGHFGADVSGPTAVAILKEALGRTHLGDPIVPDVVRGFAPSNQRSARSLDQPWAEVAW